MREQWQYGLFKGIALYSTTVESHIYDSKRDALSFLNKLYFECSSLINDYFKVRFSNGDENSSGYTDTDALGSSSNDSIYPFKYIITA